MNMTIIASCAVALIALISAHSAGAGYVIAARDKKSAAFAIAKSILSVLLVMLTVRLLTH